jgi:hypothetical protein
MDTGVLSDAEKVTLRPQLITATPLSGRCAIAVADDRDAAALTVRTVETFRSVMTPAPIMVAVMARANLDTRYARHTNKRIFCRSRDDHGQQSGRSNSYQSSSHTKLLAIPSLPERMQPRHVPDGTFCC